MKMENKAKTKHDAFTACFYAVQGLIPEGASLEYLEELERGIGFLLEAVTKAKEKRKEDER